MCVLAPWESNGERLVWPMGRGLAQGDFSSSPGSPPSPRIALPQVHNDILNIKFQISLPTFRDLQQKFLSITSDHASFSWLLWDRSPLDFLPLPQWLLSLLCPCITGLSSLACHLHLFPRVKYHKSHELGVLKQENCIVSKFWRLEVQNQRTDGAMHPHMSRGGAGRGGGRSDPALPPLASHVRQHSLALLGLWACITSTTWLSSTPSSLCVSVCKSPLFLRTSSKLD